MQKADCAASSRFGRFGFFNHAVSLASTARGDNIWEQAADTKRSEQCEERCGQLGRLRCVSLLAPRSACCSVLILEIGFRPRLRSARSSRWVRSEMSTQTEGLPEHGSWLL